MSCYSKICRDFFNFILGSMNWPVCIINSKYFPIYVYVFEITPLSAVVFSLYTDVYFIKIGYIDGPKAIKSVRSWKGELYESESDGGI